MNLSVAVAGIIEKVGISEVVSDRYKKRILVVKHDPDGQYPQYIAIEFPNGKCDEDLDKLNPGETVSVQVNLEGRKVEKSGEDIKYFNAMKGWRIDF